MLIYLQAPRLCSFAFSSVCSDQGSCIIVVGPRMMQVPKNISSSSPQFFLGNWLTCPFFMCLLDSSEINLSILFNLYSLSEFIQFFVHWIGCFENQCYMLSAHAILTGLVFCFFFYCFYSRKFLLILHSHQS